MRTGAGGDGNSLLGSADAVGGAEFTDSRPVHRQTQMPAHGGEWNRRRQPARIVERGEVRPPVLGGARGLVRGARRGVDVRLELGDEILEAVDLMRQVGGALALRVQRLLGGRLFALPFVDQHVHAQLLAAEQGKIAREPLALAVDVLADAQQVGEVAGDGVGLRPHLRHHRAERDRGAHGFQRVLGLDQQRRRRPAADPLQGGEDFHDGGLPLRERRREQMFAVVERLEARLRRLDARFDVTHARGGVDELGIERAAVGAERLDLALELGLVFLGLAPSGAGGFELLIALLERVGVGLGRRGGRGRALRCRRRPADRGIRRGLGKRGQVRPERQHDSQSRTEHKARIRAARSAENHSIQG